MCKWNNRGNWEAEACTLWSAIQILKALRYSPYRTSQRTSAGTSPLRSMSYLLFPAGWLMSTTFQHWHVPFCCLRGLSWPAAAQLSSPHPTAQLAPHHPTCEHSSSPLVLPLSPAEAWNPPIPKALWPPPHPPRSLQWLYSLVLDAHQYHTWDAPYGNSSTQVNLHSSKWRLHKVAECSRAGHKPLHWSHDGTGAPWLAQLPAMVELPHGVEGGWRVGHIPRLTLSSINECETITWLLQVQQIFNAALLDYVDSWGWQKKSSSEKPVLLWQLLVAMWGAWKSWGVSPQVRHSLYLIVPTQ